MNTASPRVCQKNEDLATGFEQEDRKITAHEFYRRAAEFYHEALRYMPDSDARMLPTYRKLKEMFDKAWRLVHAAAG